MACISTALRQGIIDTGGRNVIVSLRSSADTDAIAGMILL